MTMVSGQCAIDRTEERKRDGSFVANHSSSSGMMWSIAVSGVVELPAHAGKDRLDLEQGLTDYPLPHQSSIAAKGWVRIITYCFHEVICGARVASISAPLPSYLPRPLPPAAVHPAQRQIPYILRLPFALQPLSFPAPRTPARHAPA